MGLPVVELDAFNAKHIQRISYSRNGNGFMVVAKVDGREMQVRIPSSPDIVISRFERRTAADRLTETLAKALGIKFSEACEDGEVVWIRIG